jgi:hypothetical protein
MIKNIFLSALLVSFSITYCSNEIDEINEMIGEKEKNIDSLTSTVTDVFNEILAELEPNEKKEFIKDINVYEENIYRSFLNVHDLEKFLAKEFFNDVNKHRDMIRRIKFLFIRRKREYIALNNLFDRYQQCLIDLKFI